MRVALLTTFAASKKDPLVSVMERIHQAFLDAGLGEPVVRCNFGDAPLQGFVSNIDRVLKRYPEFGRFVTTASPMPGIMEAHRGAGPEFGPGPRKPALERVFKPLGYSCQGESGTSSLRRRTAGNLTAELRLDVGT